MEQRGGLPDAVLVSQARGAATPGDRKIALEAIADRYYLAVFRQCCRWFPDPDAARDICQTVFERAFTFLASGGWLERPEQMAAWLIEIARQRSLEYRRTDQAAGLSRTALTEGQNLEVAENDDDPRTLGAMQRAYAARAVQTAAATLTARQQQVYQLRYSENLNNWQIAERLGIPGEAAASEVADVQSLIAARFRAVILFQEGRANCPDLARIIDTEAAAAGTPAFTSVVRERIARHFGNDGTGDNCRTCDARQRELAGPLLPAMIALLSGPDVRERISETIDQIAGQAARPTIGYPGSGVPAGEASRLPRAGRRRSVLYVAALGTLAVLIALVGVLVVHSRSSSALPPAPVAKVPTASPDGWAYSALPDASPVISVSCPTSTFCMATDNSYHAYIFTGTAWRGPYIINQARAKPGAGADYLSVSCATPQFCAAVDNTGHLYTFNGSSWSAPQALSLYGGLSVSCTAAVFCLAMDNNGYAYTYRTGTWTTTKGVAPEAEDLSQDAVYQVSCVSASFCASVSIAGAAQTYNGTTWTTPVKIETRASTGGTPHSLGMTLTCPSTAFCVAVDSIGVSYTFNGTTWTHNGAVAGNGDYGSISCSSASRCITLDNQGHLFQFNGSAWNLDESFTFPGSSDGLLAASTACPSPSMCVITGEGHYAIQR